MRRFKNENGFTLLELMLALLLLSVLSLTVWGVLGQYAVFWKRTGDKLELYDNLRIALDRMGREIRYAQSISAVSDTDSVTFVNAEGNTIRYYRSTNAALQRSEKGVSSPLASDIACVHFIYTIEDGLTIDASNIDTQKLQPGWPKSIKTVTIFLTAEKQEQLTEPLVLMQKVQLRALP